MYNLTVKSFSIIFILLAGAVTSYSAEIEFSGNLSGVSTYVWRGVKANNGPALQSDAALSYKSFTAGLWSSSIDFSGSQEIETDLYALITLPTEAFSSALGVTVYMFDLSSFNVHADAEYEIFAKVGAGPVGLNVFYVPKQNSTTNKLNRSNYWLELTGGATWLGADLSANICYGTYSSRWLPAGETKDAAALLLLTAGKSLNEDFSVFWTYSLDLFNSGFENIFYFGGTYSF